LPLFNNAGLIAGHSVPLEFFLRIRVPDHGASGAAAASVGKALVVIGFILMLFVEQILFDGHTHHLPEEQEESENKAPLLERTRTIVVTYRDPLITEAAVLLHSILENITLGLAVRSRS
jgi:zinc transporter ZupT